MRIFIVAGSPEAKPPTNLIPGPGDRVIAADHGADHARRWGWPVHLLIGDLDSLSPAVAADLAAAGTPTLIAPTEKDETDLELALMQALAAAPHQIVICAGLGGRPDHLLANVLLLARPDLIGQDVVIADGGQTLRMIRGDGAVRLSGTAGDLLSLLPFGGHAVGITTRGLRYPLRDETLYFGQARGISNVFEEREVEVRLRQGLLLAVHMSGGTEVLKPISTG